MRLRVSGLGFGVWGLGFGVWGLGFGVWDLEFGVWGFDFDFRVSGLGSWVSGSSPPAPPDFGVEGEGTRVGGSRLRE